MTTVSNLNKTIIVTPRNSRILREEKANDTSFIGTAVVGEEAASQYSERYYKYDPKNWNPMLLYRTPTDVINQVLREAGGDGADRYEIGHALGLNCHIKSGNRIVSQYIQELTKTFPNEIGQFHKMNGKIRSIRYYIKECHVNAFQVLYDEFKKITGRDCPFKCGDVFKFPGANLNTLRLSDITLKRMNYVLKKLEEEKVVVTYFRLVKHIQDIESKEGYKFQMDKKSLVKIIVALERKGLLKITESVVNYGDSEISVKCVCHRSIIDKNDPLIPIAIANLIKIYESESRLFPSGQLRYPTSTRQNNEDEDPKKKAQRLASAERKRLKRQRDKESRLSSSNAKDKEVKPPKSKKRKESTTDSSSARETSSESNVECEDTLNETVSTRKVIKINKFVANQGKSMKLMMLHELLFYFVNCYKPGMKSYQDRFPRVNEVKLELVGKPDSELDASSLASSLSKRVIHCMESIDFKIPINEIPVVVNEESFYRFVTPLAPGSEIPDGWFAISELLNVLPLTIIAFISKYSNDHPILMEFLKDPIKRYIMYADLPPIFRHKIFPISKLTRVIEHKLMLLAGMGLLILSKKDENKKEIEVETSQDLFYLTKVKTIRDTSTAPPSYMKITGDMNEYKSYIHKLDSIEKITKFWHHVRAISLSTHFSFKRLLGDGDLDCNRQFLTGLIEKDKYRRPIQQYNEELNLNDSDKGCGGFHPSLFMHLKRHWDINTGPDDIFKWFSAKLSLSGESVKEFIQKSVAKLNNGWNSCIHLLMASDGLIYKGYKKKQSKISDPNCTGLPILKRISTQSLSNNIKHKKINGESVIDDKGYLIVKRSKTKRKHLDEKDIRVIQDRTQLRVKYTKREKDLLIMIRAVSYFLKPIYRIWVSPSLIRDLMHNYVPESRTKTIQNILSAGTREMGRAQGRVEFFRYVGVFEGNPGMVELRGKMIDTTKSKENESVNDNVFLDAFNLAYSIIFDDDKNVPEASVSDENFFNYYKEKNEDIIDGDTSIPNDIFSPPKNLIDIQQELSFHVMLSSLLHNTTECFSDESIKIEKLAFTLIKSRLSDVIIKMKSESIICKPKGMEQILNNDSIVVSASMAILSTHFRYMFNVRYHSDIILQSINDYKNIIETKDCTNIYTPGGLVLVGDLMESRGMHSSITMGKEFNKIIDMEEELSGSSGLKRNKHLESANMMLDDIHLRYTDIPKLNFKPVDPIEVASEMIQKVPFSEIKWLDEDTFIKDFKNDTVRTKQLLNLFPKLKDATNIGLTAEEISDILELSYKETVELLNILIQKNLIFVCGIDKRRYISIRHSTDWVVASEERICFMMRPWLNSKGDVNISILKWMSECILLKIIDNPVFEILEFLEKIKTVILERKVTSNSVVLDPFTKEKKMITIWEVQPFHNALTRFAQTFANVDYKPLFTKECYQYF
ncbi:Hypothetical protein SRAE_2000345800 [Strongyloides ratti]|uniref:General transcription factor 3C polypeptide 1 n=1 Tax=Strongyloides ratti TaxID=34506 RepID=A0A090LKW4_STRRB|nr:Hypothetical protein SRAE_2000345800 [Strongyloides ratti]CEF68803.1 Hypothetical protein SRAE_2000345800 [Strongyloides ratti]